MGKKTAKPEAPSLDGLDAMQRAARAFTDRPRKQVTPKRDLTAGHWAGMPAYDEGSELPRLTIRFASEADRDEFVSRHGIAVSRRHTGKSWTTRWPEAADRDMIAVRFVEASR